MMCLLRQQAGLQIKPWHPGRAKAARNVILIPGDSRTYLPDVHLARHVDSGRTAEEKT